MAPRSSCLLLLSIVVELPLPAAAQESVEARYARVGLDCVHRAYPNKIAHVLNGDKDALPPRNAPYEGGHWLGTFAVYALTSRGLGASR